MHAVTPARWAELYCAPGCGYPSCEELGRRFGVKGDTVRRRLVAARIRPRSRAEQCRIDSRLGRHHIPRNPNPPAFPPGTGAGGRRGRLPRRQREAIAAANRARSNAREVPCSWCGDPVLRRPSEIARFTACTQSHASQAAMWARFHPGAARPLVAERLRALVAGAPATWEDAERIGRGIGAGEAEIAGALEPCPARERGK